MTDPRLGRRTKGHDRAIGEGTEARDFTAIPDDEWVQIVARFWKFVDRQGPVQPDGSCCWLWTGGDPGGARGAHGGPRIGYVSTWWTDTDGTKRRHNIRAHHIAYALTHGRAALTRGVAKLIEHRCIETTDRCVNPEHEYIARELEQGELPVNESQQQRPRRESRFTFTQRPNPAPTKTMRPTMIHPPSPKAARRIDRALYETVRAAAERRGVTFHDALEQGLREWVANEQAPVGDDDRSVVELTVSAGGDPAAAVDNEPGWLNAANVSDELWGHTKMCLLSASPTRARRWAILDTLISHHFTRWRFSVASALASWDRANGTSEGANEDRKITNDEKLELARAMTSSGVERDWLWWVVVKNDSRGKDCPNWGALPHDLWFDIICLLRMWYESERRAASAVVFQPWRLGAIPKEG